MKRKFTFLMTALLIMFSYAGLAQVVSGTTYSTPSVTGLPDGWSGEDGDGTTYMKLIAAEHYIQTANFEQNGFTSITVKARKYGGPSAAQAQISVSWYGSENEETVLGTIDPTNTTLTDYTINGPATTTSGTGYVKIQCKGASANKGSGVSEVTITYTEPGGTTPTIYTVTYNANVTGVASIVDNYTEGSNVTLRPANTFTYDGYIFSEWNTQADGDGEPFDAGDVIENIQANIELYAIWTENPVSDEQWVLTNLADLTENDVFVIVGNNGSNYAMANDKGTTNPPTAVSVTIANEAITSTVAANIQWNISGNATDGYVFYPNGDAESWLYCTNTNNGVRVGTNEANTFNMEASSGYLVHQGTSRYVGIYNSESWRCYTSINTNIQNQTFAFYKKVTGGVIPPSITAENVSIEYNATSGSIAYTINNGVDGGTISAAVTEGDWFTLGEGTTSPISFTCSANEAGTGRTATVTLTYTYNRATATANVTVTQAGNPNATMTIAEVRAQGTGSVATEGTVTSITGSTNKTVYIQDATAAIVVYGNFTAAVGDEIRVAGTLTTYHGLMEITNPTVTIISQGNTIDPELMTIAEINASTNQGWYIRVEEATVTRISGSANSQNTTIAQGNDTILVYGNLGVTVAMNDIISLNGNIGNHDGVQIANPQNVEVQQNINPAILLNTYEIAVFAEGGEGDIDVTYQNFVVNNEKLSVSFYDENGVNQVTCDWITVEFDANNNVHYIVEANEGAVRTAYFKVEYDVIEPEDIKGYVTGQEPVYSDLVTVSQAAAPTFAALPFEFDGGRAAIDTIDGLYQEGLGSDYNSSPKLRFDSTDDYLLLQFNEVPGKLTFEIKGNSFSGGTFTVQTSEDGVTYTDLEVYGNLTSTVQPESFNLGENVRYVKWVYTVKVSGNVALGKIKLLKPVTMYSLTVEPFENLEIFTFIGGDESEMALEGAGTIQVAEGDQVMLSVTANEGYEISSLIVDGVEHVNDITEEETYTFTMPGHNVTISATAVEVTPSTTDEYVLYTGELVEGDYIIYYNGKAMNNVVSNDRLQYAEIEPEDDVITTDNATIVWHIAPNDEGYWTIFSADANAYAASTGVKNKAQMLEDGTDDKAMWSESLTENGTYEFINKYNANANVNACLRNNSTYGFACYATTIGGALSLYKKVEQTTFAQTLELTPGWNWVSIYLDNEDPEEMMLLLQEALGENGLQIAAADDFTTYADGEWGDEGDLEELSNDRMYMIEVADSCTVVLQGMPADPADYTITIVPGWNWIGFPSAEVISIEDAFADFEAEDDDMIVCPFGYTTFVDEWGDEGELEELTPGVGYMYFYNGEEAQDLIIQTGDKARRIMNNMHKPLNLKVKAVMPVSDPSKTAKVEQFKTKK